MTLGEGYHCHQDVLDLKVESMAFRIQNVAFNICCVYRDSSSLRRTIRGYTNSAQFRDEIGCGQHPHGRDIFG